MSATAITIAAISRAAAPLVKDIYDGAKGGARTALAKWNTKGFTAKLARNLQAIEKVRTIWSPEESVSLRSFYCPGRVLYKGVAPRVVADTNDLAHGNTVIEGIVGQGKSMLMRYLAVQEVIKEGNKRIPVFLELRRVTKTLSLNELIRKTLSLYDIKIDDEIFEYLACSGKMVLLLDGFDEIGGNLVEEVLFDVEALSIKYPDLQIIVSSRPNNEIQKLPSFKLAKIVELRPSDYEGFLRSLGLGTDRVVEIVDAIGDSPESVSGLITTPLMLTLVVFVYQAEKEIPDDLSAFFEKLFYTVFTRHDKLKPAFERQHYSGLSERKLQSLFEAFCFMCLQAGYSRTLLPDQFLEAFEIAQSYVDGASCAEVDFKKDITKVACLMLEEGVGEVTFLHKSIAEYHAAAFIKGCDDEFASRFYSMAKADWVRWRECLDFLSGVDSYRYARYFEVPCLEDAIRLFEYVLSCPTARQINEFLPVWTRNLRVSFSYIGKNTYEYESVGEWTNGGGIFEDELCDLVADAMIAVVPDALSREDLEDLMERERHFLLDEGNSASIGIVVLFEEWGMEGLRHSLISSIEIFKRRLELAQIAADKLTKRSLIFEKRKPAI